MLLTLARVIVGLVAAAVALIVLRSALRTIVIPRGVPDRLSRVIFRVLDAPTSWRAGRAASSTKAVDRRTATLAPRILLAQLITWLTGIWLAGAGVQWALGGGSAGWAFGTSAAAMTTVGVPATGAASAAGYVEAVIGLGVLALIIGYLPSFYAAFSQREAMVSKLAMRTGTPPHGPAILRHLWHPVGSPGLLNEAWKAWEPWFIDLGESHTSFPVLAFYHSPQTDKSWITAAGAILDSAALALAAVEADWGPEAGMCLHAGVVSLRHIADFHGISHHPSYYPETGTEQIAVTRDEVVAACQDLQAAGLPVASDLGAAYDRFRARRAEYDQILLVLCAYLYAPPAPWSSDKAVGGRPRSPVIHLGPGSLCRVYPDPDSPGGVDPPAGPSR